MTDELMGNALLAGAITLAGGAIGAGIGDGVAGSKFIEGSGSPAGGPESLVHAVSDHGQPCRGDVLSMSLLWRCLSSPHRAVNRGPVWRWW